MLLVLAIGVRWPSVMVVANYGIECTVLFYCEFIVDLIDQFGFMKEIHIHGVNLLIM